MKKAIIDLGTNTFNLLIAEVEEGSFEVVEDRREPVLLGKGGINDGIITEEAIQRGKKAIGFFKERCDAHAVKSVRCFGTSALRAAKNTPDFIELIQESFGYTIKVISGEEEAQLIYEGITLVHEFNDPGVIMDIGGGSTEFILANSQGAQQVNSFDIGVSRIYQHFQEPKKFSDALVKEMVAFLDQKENGILEDFKCPILIGSSGSFETFYEMFHQRDFIYQGEISEMSLADIMSVLEWTIYSEYEERVNHPWIIPLRKKMLPIAAIKVRWALEKVKAEKLLISPYSLKEGALMMDNF